MLIIGNGLNDSWQVTELILKLCHPRSQGLDDVLGFEFYGRVVDCELFDGVGLAGGGPWVGELELDVLGLWGVEGCGVKGF